jgi:hypothetical protein
MWGSRPFALVFAVAMLAGAAPAWAAAPTASMLGASSSSATSTTVYGAFDGQGQTTTSHFAYDLSSSPWCTTNGLAGSPGHTTAEQPDSYDGFAYQEISGLTSGSTYCVALVATNASGTTTSSQIAFTQGVPWAETYSVASRSATTANVNGDVYGAGQPTTYRVRYDLKSSTWCTTGGASGTPANATAPQTLPSPDGESHEVSVALTGLTGGTAYCAAISATNGSGTDTTAPVAFVQGQPRADTWFVSSDSATTATVYGGVDPAGQSTTYSVGYDLASSSWCTGDGSGTPAHTTPPQTLATTTPGDHDVTVSLTGLTGGTKYCARLQATNASGVSAPDDAEPFTPGLPRAFLYDISPTSATSIVVSGTVSTLGQTTTYRVAYDDSSSDWCNSWGESGSPAHSTPAQSLTTDNGESNPVSVAISGLTSGTHYCAGLIATNASGSSPPDISEFTQGAPKVRHSTPHSTGPTTARISGSVNPAGLSTTYRVLYDVSTSQWCASYGSEGTPAHATAQQTLPFTDVGSHSVQVALTDMAPGTQYCAQLVAQNAAATSDDGLMRFTQGVPEASTVAIHPTGPTSAQVAGTVNPIAQTTTYHVDWDVASSDWCSSWGDESTPAHSTPTQTLAFADDAEHSVAVDLTGLAAGQEYCAAVVATNPSGTSGVFPDWFTQGLPELSLDDVHSTGATTAQATGTVDPGGQTTAYHVGYDDIESAWCDSDGRDGTPAFATPETTLGPTDTVAHPVTFTLSGLTQGHDYCAVLVATNASGTATTWGEWFRQGTPSGTVTDARSTGAGTATVDGIVNAASQTTTYTVLWDLASSDWCDSGGWDGSPAHSTPTQTLTFSDGDDHAVSVALSGLTARTDYCAAIKVENPTWWHLSDPVFFTSGSDAPAVTTTGASGLSDTAATLNGTVVPHGTPTSYHFEYGPTTAYGTSTPVASAGAGDSPRTVSAAIAGLTGATTYHYRLVADNAGGTNAGSDMTFTTANPPSDPPPSDPPPSDPPDNDPPAQDPPHSDPPPADPPAPAPPGDSGPPTTGSSTPAPAADTTAPRLTANLRGVTRRKLLIKKGVAVNVGCDESCTVTVDLVAPAKLARKLRISRALGTVTATIDPSHAARLVARLSAKAKAKLAHAGTFKLVVGITAKDRSGNGSSTTRTVLVSPS